MLAKTFVGGLVAKVAMGAGVAAASVTVAGAAGVLPGPAHDVVATVVAAATPFELHEPGVNLQLVDDPTSTSSSSTSTTILDDEEEGTEGGATERKVNHGACVSAAAKDKIEGGEPNAHGKTVSSVARTDCGKEDTGSKATTPTTVGSEPTSSTSTTPTTAASSRRGETSDPSESGGRGNGNGGNGNGGKDGGGKGSPGKD